jgi:cytidylate kinase
VADRLGFAYLDSGAMYRAAALRAVRLGVSLGDHAALGRAAEGAAIELTLAGRGPVLLDGVDVTADIRAPAVSSASSIVSAVPAVRRALVRQQRAFAAGVDCVVEGRDIGTVVFPDADLKVYLTASIGERARRRMIELAGRGIHGDEVAIRSEIAERDRRDSTREDSPLRKAADAVEVDTTGLSIEEQVEAVVRIARERMRSAPGGGTRS